MPPGIIAQAGRPSVEADGEPVTRDAQALCQIGVVLDDRPQGQQDARGSGREGDLDLFGTVDPAGQLQGLGDCTRHGLDGRQVGRATLSGTIEVYEVEIGSTLIS